VNVFKPTIVNVMGLTRVSNCVTSFAFGRLTSKCCRNSF